MNFRSKRTRVNSEDAIATKKMELSKKFPRSLVFSTQAKRVAASQPVLPSNPSNVALNFGPFQPSKVGPTFIPSLVSQKSKNVLKASLSKNFEPSKHFQVLERTQDKINSNETLAETENQLEDNGELFAEHPSSESDHGESGASDQQDMDQSEDTQLRPPSKKKIYRPQVKHNWNDNNLRDLDEEVEIEEVQEDKSLRLGTMSGTILAQHVWMLPRGRRIIVPFNEFDQPIRKGRIVLVHFLSDLAKNGTYTPLGETSWKHVDIKFQKEIVEIVREKFVLPDHVKIDKKILSLVSTTWKQYRCELKKQHYHPSLTKEQILERKPNEVIEEQWLKLFSYWQTKKAKKLSNIGQRARASHAHAHTTGSRSIAQWRIEFEKIHKRKPRSQLEFFKFTHATKEGGYIDNTLTQDFVDYADSEVSRRAADQSQERSVPEIEDDVFNEVMHLKDSNRVIGYGYGVSKCDVLGLDGELRKRYNGSISGSSEIQEIKGYLASIEKKNAESEKKNAENVQKLQQENHELRKQNEEINKKYDALLSQLSVVICKLDGNSSTS